MPRRRSLAARPPALAAIVWLSWLPTACSFEAWVTAEDRAAASEAQAAAALYCQEGFKGEVDAESGRQALETILGGENIVRDIMAGAETSDDLGVKAKERLDPVWLAMQAGPVVMAIIMAALWFFCCWSAWPCCRCCRCFEKERKTRRPLKLFLAILGGLLLFGILFAANYAWAGYIQAIDGFDNLACTSAKLLNSSLSGESDPYFMGLLPMLSTFEELEQKFNTSSAMLAEVSAVLDSTRGITDSVTIAVETVSLLEEILSQIPSEISENRHICHLCDVIAPALADVAAGLRGSVGAKLSEAREEVMAQLSGPAMEEMRNNLRTGGGPLIQIKDSVRDTFSIFTDENKFNVLRDLMRREVPIGCSCIILAAVCLAGCMSISLLSFGICERSGPSRLHVSQKPYTDVVHQCAFCTWCCGWFYAILAFIVGGILSATTVPLAGMCLVMDDLSSSLLTDIGPAIDFNLTGDEGTMIKDIIDQCFARQAGQSANAKLLDIVFVRENASAEPVTMSQKIVGGVKDQVKGKFAGIATSPSQTDLVTSAEVLSLIDMLSNPIDMMILPAGLPWRDDNYSAIENSYLWFATFASVRCASHTASASIPGYAHQVVKGVNVFVDRLVKYGVETSLRSDCAKTVNCSDEIGTNRRSLCDAGNRYVELKQNIRDLTYRCDVFWGTDGASECDPLNMAFSGSAWSGGCVQLNGTMVRKAKPCNLTDFAQYIQDYGTRIQKAMQRIDDTVASTGAQISGDLELLVDTHIVWPIEAIADGVTCGFMGQYYQEVVDGLCYQGVLGFTQIAHSYLACAILTLFMLVLMYGLWRRAIDNVNAFKDRVRKTADISLMPPKFGVVPPMPPQSKGA